MIDHATLINGLTELHRYVKLVIVNTVICGRLLSLKLG